jgi:hypothetical protein
MDSQCHFDGHCAGGLKIKFHNVGNVSGKLEDCYSPVKPSEAPNNTGQQFHEPHLSGTSPA